MTTVAPHAQPHAPAALPYALPATDAFTALVLRHGPMVLAVCRRMLRDGRLAEAAFRETFLRVARDANRLAKPAWFGSRLYRTAYSITLRAKVRTRSARATRSAVDGLAGQLDYEISHLPAKYRVPLVLCSLSQASEHEAARGLGWAERTVRRRRIIACKLLLRRLERRGLKLSRALLRRLLTREMAAVALTPALTQVAIRACILAANGTSPAVCLPCRTRL